MTWSTREKTNCIIVEWCCLDNRQRQMWTATQLWQKIFSNRSPAFCVCQCPAIACDFPLILRNWSVLFSCLTVTLVLQCHFYRSLLCSNHLLSPLPLPFFSLSLSLSVTDTTLSSERGKNPSSTLPWFRAFCAWTVPAAADWLFVLMWKEPFSDVSLGRGALSHKHHLHHQEGFFPLHHIALSWRMLKRGGKHKVKAIMKAASADPCGQSEFEFSIFSLHAFCLDLLSQFTPYWLQ